MSGRWQPGMVVMERNIGNLERALRVFGGVVLLAMVLVGPQTVWGLLGILPLLTGLSGWCPPYSVLGISTCRAQRTSADE
mgnify:CR=1 FL=1